MHIQRLNPLTALILIVLLPICLFEAIQLMFFSDMHIMIQTYQYQLSINRIEEIFQNTIKYKILGYFIIPVIILIRVCYTSICIYIGCLFSSEKVRLNNIVRISILAEFVFVLAGLAKLVILVFFKEVNTLDDLQFQPLSLMELFNRELVDQLFFYPLSLISIFEALYWLVLAWLLMDVVEKPFGSTLKTVASSYGTGLLLWVLFVMFLTVNLS